jgi:tetratricopeptide (TPR) repeat protein
MAKQTHYRLWHLGMVILLIVIGGCAHVRTLGEFQGQAWEQYRTVEALTSIEPSDPEKAVKGYEAILAQTSKVEYPINRYQETLQKALETIQKDPDGADLPEEAALGVPEIYARRLQTAVKAHHGLARVHVKQGNLPKAEEHATAAVDLLLKRSNSPAFMTERLIESYGLLKSIYEQQGKTGKALIQRLNQDLLLDHLKSEGGILDFYAEKDLFYGAGSNPYSDAERLLSEVNSYRVDKVLSKTMAVAGGVMQANAAFQQFNAGQALADSGGVMTPQVQMAQMNAQFAQLQAQTFTKLVKMDAERTRDLDLKTTSSAVPTFGQQLVDPRMGVKSRTIVKDFAANAATAGGGSALQQNAQQVIIHLNTLPTVQGGEDMTKIIQQVGQFTEVFNGFLSVVQDIRGHQLTNSH